MLKRNYLVAEDNGGGLWLFITNPPRNSSIHVYNGFEHEVGSLVNALRELEDCEDAYESWENDIEELHGVDALWYCSENGMSIINRNGVMYPHAMGSSAISEFSLNDEIIPCTRAYMHSKDVYISCDSMKYNSELNELCMYKGYEIIAMVGITEGMSIVAISDNKMSRYEIEAGVCYETI